MLRARTVPTCRRAPLVLFDNHLEWGLDGFNSMSFTYTCGANAKALMIAVATGLSVAPHLGSSFTRTCTYNGVPLTSLGVGSTNPANGSGFVELWYMLNPPVSTSLTVYVQSEKSGVTCASLVACVASYNGVSSVGTPVQSQANIGVAPSISVASGPNNRVVAALASGAAISGETDTVRSENSSAVTTTAGFCQIQDQAGETTAVIGAAANASYFAAIAVELRGGSGGTPPPVILVNRPPNPALISYAETPSSGGSFVSQWAQPGSLIVIGRTAYNDSWVHQCTDGGATVLLYLDCIISINGGRYHSKLLDASEFGGAVPNWPGNPAAYGGSILKDFRTVADGGAGLLQSKLPGVLDLIHSELPHISGIFFDDLGSRSYFPFNWDTWSNADKERWRNGIIALLQTGRTKANAYDWFTMANGTWFAEPTAGIGSGGYPDRTLHGCSLVDGGMVEGHPSTATWWFPSMADSTQWGNDTPRGIPYHFVLNSDSSATRDGWIANNVSSWVQYQPSYAGTPNQPWKSTFTDFHLPNRKV